MADAVAATPDAAKPVDPSPKTADAQVAGKAAAEATANEWKPEPRQWSWKDLFTAPMLAFKPKCMLVSAATMLAIGLWNWLFGTFSGKLPAILVDVVGWLWLIVGLVIFSLGATLVAVFMKADLLDDEFLSFKEAIGQYKTRLMPAIMVPVFLLGLLGAFYVLIAVPELIGSIPYAGPVLYAVLYPLGFLLGLFVKLLGVAVVLSVFVFPAIVAIRKHGWFDNVVDTFEAVGTKPHILIGSLALVFVLIGVSRYIAFGGMHTLNNVAHRMPFGDLKETESHAAHVRLTAFGWAGSVVPGTMGGFLNRFDSDLGGAGPVETIPAAQIDGFSKVTGTITGIWQILIGALIFGYCFNLFVGGGMLTYLVVREDDYWDDEDLEDLDQLAKELEEEAKQDAAKVSAAAPPAPITPVVASAAPVAPTPDAVPPAATPPPPAGETKPS